MQARIEHVAIWVSDLELMRAFYTEALPGECGDYYKNPASGFESYFISLGEGARLELMHQPGLSPRPAGPAAGYAHLALSLGSREEVDTAVLTLVARGVPIGSEPRMTGDGYYEAVVLDPEGNVVELTV
jgi:lactoylglutathione lyase